MPKKKSLSRAVTHGSPGKPSFFSKQTVNFLREMSKNNDRDWFKENKERYESLVRSPALELILAMQSPLEKISECFLAESKKVGGSLMRPYRDTRFGNDKTPLKTNIGIHFRHRIGKDVHAPGFYIHIEPGDMFLGAGVWHPDSPTLKKIREAIDLNPTAWLKTVNQKSLTSQWKMHGESISRPPRGYSAEHPAIEALKLKDHILIANFSESELIDPAFPEFLQKKFQASAPFMLQLCQAIGLPF